ncbi:T9SS type A sorting domain-containing protein [Rufibacter roseus]|uniref:T9SS type A sorting domain-containing protein n=1 Tax=Rufibacter roseus TaxID=1567108 RepID=A0ABW2DIG0_9BACT|nr:T9SS type A sorting domain-containing protein [Rufibacter roseus]
MGTVAGTTSGSAQVSIPTSQSAGTRYRIRVVASRATPNMVVENNGTDFRIAVPPAAPVITYNEGLCEGGTLSLSANNVTGATYTWAGPNNFSASGRVVSIPNALANAAGTYTVTMVLNGCSVIGSKEISIKPAMANAGPDLVICLGQSVQLQATGGVSYTWSPSNTLSNANISNPVATPSATTTYTVSVTNENGCVRTDQVVVTVSPLPVITLTPTAASICKGSSVQLQASGAVSYSWSPATGLDDPTSATPIASPDITTTYTVTGTSAAGCISSKTITVTVRPLPVANAGFDRTLCSGQALSMGGTNTSSGTYLWEPATGLSSATVRNPILNIQNTSDEPITTVYKLTVTSNGCVSTDEVAITVNPAVPANAGPDAAICAGGSTQLNASGGVLYKWAPTTNLSDPNIANPVAFPTATTRYIVTVTNAEGCSRNDTVFVNVNPNPVVNITPTAPAICVGSSVQLTASGAATYLWSPATGLDDPTSATPVASPTETTTYTVIGYSAAGCPSVARTVTVRVNPYPVANAGPDKVVCAYQPTVLGAPAVAGYSYQWSPAIGLNNPRAANPTLTYPGDNLTPMKVQYTLTVTANGCVSTDVVEITVNPTAYAGPAVSICKGESTQLQASGGISYSWSPATGLSDPNIANPIATPTATTTYTVTVTGQDRLCSSTASVRVTVNPIPTVTATASTDSPVCPGSPVTLTASGADTYLWSPATGLDNPTSATPVATPKTTTTYTVTGRTRAGCTSTAQVTITVNPAEATITATGPTALCTGDKITLIASEGAAYEWSTGSVKSSIVVSSAGTYTVKVTQANGCSSVSEPIEITVSPSPTTTLNPFATVCKDASAFALEGGSPAGGTYSGKGVFEGQFNPATAGVGTHNITFTYINESGCSASATQQITVSTCLSTADVLQASTLKVYPNPAQDKLFTEVRLLKKESITLTLTNLKGQVVYKTTASAPAGEFKHVVPVQDLPKGVYVLQYHTSGAVMNHKIVIGN